MDYIKKTYTDKAVEVQISSFAGKGGVTEYHVLLAITDRTLPFSGQLQNIQRAYVAVIQEVLPDDATAVFRRYFLSDAANQADLVMVWECENSYCPLSIVEQAPLNGSKIGHVDLVSDRYHCRNDQKRNVESQTQPLYTILDRGLLQ